MGGIVVDIYLASKHSSNIPKNKQSHDFVSSLAPRWIVLTIHFLSSQSDTSLTWYCDKFWWIQYVIQFCKQTSNLSWSNMWCLSLSKLQIFHSQHEMLRIWFGLSSVDGILWTCVWCTHACSLCKTRRSFPGKFIITLFELIFDKIGTNCNDFKIFLWTFVMLSFFPIYELWEDRG